MKIKSIIGAGAREYFEGGCWFWGQSVRVPLPCLKLLRRFPRMHNSRAALGHIFARAKHASSSSFRADSPLLSLLLLLPLHSSAGHGRFFVANRRSCSYAAEQFSDDEYECDFDNHQVLIIIIILIFLLLLLIFEISHLAIHCLWVSAVIFFFFQILTLFWVAEIYRPRWGLSNGKGQNSDCKLVKGLVTCAYQVFFLSLFWISCIFLLLVYVKLSIVNLS